MDTTLATPEWQAYTQQFWGVDPVRLDYTPRGENGPALRSVFYADRRGRLLLPPYQPHLPLQFTPTPTEAGYRVERQWIETARLLVDEMLVRGIRGGLTFPPSLTDPRPWKWGFFRVTPNFTNLIDFPFTWDHADRVVRQQANKALRAGFVCRRTDNLNDALSCLEGSQGRKGFAYGMTLAGLELAWRLVGREVVRVYVCHSPSGDPATARIVLHRPGGRALDWMAGTKDEHLKSGATQLLLSHALSDLHQAGATGYNSCGADVEAVAQTKLLWGGTLATQYNIQAYDWRSHKWLLGGWLRFMKHRAAVRRRRRAAPATPAEAPAAGSPPGE